MARQMRVIQCSFVAVFYWTIFIPGATPALVDVPNIALNKPTRQSSTHMGFGLTASRSGNAVDGNFAADFDSNSCTHTNEVTGWHWWMVDLEKSDTIGSIRITNRADCCSEKLRAFTVEVSERDPSSMEGFPGRTEASVCFTRVAPVPPTSVNIDCDEPVNGRYIRMVAENTLTLCELEVFTSAVPFTSINLAFRRLTKQSSTNRGRTSGRAVDGNTDAMVTKESCTQTKKALGWHWWEVDLGSVHAIGHVRITNSVELSDFTIEACLKEPELIKGFPGRTESSVCFTMIESLPPGTTTIACDEPVYGRTIRVVKNRKVDAVLSLCEVEIFEASLPTTRVPILGINLALNKPATQSSTALAGGPERGVDGNPNPDFSYGHSCTHTEAWLAWHWWMVDLLGVHTVGSIRVTNRGDCCSDRLRDFSVEISVEDPRSLQGFPGRTRAPVCFTRLKALFPLIQLFECDQPIRGRFVRLLKNRPIGSALSLCEIEIYEPTTRTTTVSKRNEHLETPRQASVDVAGRDIASRGRHVSGGETKDVPWIERWTKWKDWMAEVRLRNSEVCIKEGCTICC